MKKLHFISRNWRKENCTESFGSSSIQTHSFDYLKPFINIINEVYDLSIKYRYSDILLKNHTLHL